MVQAAFKTISIECRWTSPIGGCHCVFDRENYIILDCNQILVKMKGELGAQQLVGTEERMELKEISLFYDWLVDRWAFHPNLDRFWAKVPSYSLWHSLFMMHGMGWTSVGKIKRIWFVAHCLRPSHVPATAYLTAPERSLPTRYSNRVGDNRKKWNRVVKLWLRNIEWEYQSSRRWPVYTNR